MHRLSHGGELSPQELQRRKKIDVYLDTNAKTSAGLSGDRKIRSDDRTAEVSRFKGFHALCASVETGNEKGFRGIVKNP